MAKRERSAVKDCGRDMEDIPLRGPTDCPVCGGDYAVLGATHCTCSSPNCEVYVIFFHGNAVCIGQSAGWTFDRIFSKLCRYDADLPTSYTVVARGLTRFEALVLEGLLRVSYEQLGMTIVGS
jgi:hypothetical protein